MSDEIRYANDAFDLAARDAYIAECGQAFDSFLPAGCGVVTEVLLDAWRDLRPLLIPCDCPLDPYHRWNCPLTPIWAQTIRDLDINPWTALGERL